MKLSEISRRLPVTMGKWVRYRCVPYNREEPPQSVTFCIEGIVSNNGRLLHSARACIYLWSNDDKMTVVPKHVMNNPETYQQAAEWAHAIATLEGYHIAYKEYPGPT